VLGGEAAAGSYSVVVRTVILDPPSAGLDELLERRRRSGLDRLDEVWEGVLHVVPAPSHAHANLTQQLAELLAPLARAAGLEPTMAEFNLGQSEHDFRVPDGGLHRPGAAAMWHPTAALVVEITSPEDETWEKLPFYAAHHVDEVLIVDPHKRAIDWLALERGEYQAVGRSGLIELGPAELAQRIDWPDVE
jgi:Uma2 family endonuclease